MATSLQIINRGLNKIGSSSVSRIDPPSTSLERYVSDNYPYWKATELTKRRWVFATEQDVLLPRVQSATSDPPLQRTDGKNNKFALPEDCLRPVREKYTEWLQSRRHLYSEHEALRISYVVDVDESEFDPLFGEVLACRVAYECCEYVTQSNTKKADAMNAYDSAVADAGRVNAFIRGPEDVTADDSAFPFLAGRH